MNKAVRKSGERSSCIFWDEFPRKRDRERKGE